MRCKRAICGKGWGLVLSSGLSLPHFSYTLSLILHIPLTLLVSSTPPEKVAVSRHHMEMWNNTKSPLILLYPQQPPAHLPDRRLTETQTHNVRNMIAPIRRFIQPVFVYKCKYTNTQIHTHCKEHDLSLYI